MNSILFDSELHRIAYGLHNIAYWLPNMIYGLHKMAYGPHNMEYGLQNIAYGIHNFWNRSERATNQQFPPPNSSKASLSACCELIFEC